MTTTTLRQQLLKKGYDKEYLDLLSDPNFSHVRFTLEEILSLENLVGKEIKLITHKRNGFVDEKTILVDKVDPAVVGAGIFSNKIYYHSITKKSFEEIDNSIIHRYL